MATASLSWTIYSHILYHENMEAIVENVQLTTPSTEEHPSPQAITSDRKGENLLSRLMARITHSEPSRTLEQLAEPLTETVQPALSEEQTTQEQAVKVAATPQEGMVALAEGMNPESLTPEQQAQEFNEAVSTVRRSWTFLKHMGNDAAVGVGAAIIAIALPHLVGQLDNKVIEHILTGGVGLASAVKFGENGLEFSKKDAVFSAAAALGLGETAKHVPFPHVLPKQAAGLLDDVYNAAKPVIKGAIGTITPGGK